MSAATPGEAPATGREEKWTTCVVCRHLRIEHKTNLKACEVLTRDDRNPNGRRCDCTGFRPPKGGTRQ